MPRWCWCDLVHKSGFALRNMCNPLSYALLGCLAPYFCPICPNWDANFNKTCLKLQKCRTSKQEGQCSEFRTSDLFFCGPNQIVRGLQSNIICIIMKCIVVPISTWTVDVFWLFSRFLVPWHSFALPWFPSCWKFRTVVRVSCEEMQACMLHVTPTRWIKADRWTIFNYSSA